MRNEQIEKQFKTRYNRDIEAHQFIDRNDDKEVIKVTVNILYNGVDYVITEYMKRDQSTDYVVSGEPNNLKRYERYIDAEVHVADLIGARACNALEEVNCGNTC